MLTVESSKVDVYRRPAEVFGWKRCSYLVAEQQNWRSWMDDRLCCIRVLAKLSMDIRQMVPLEVHPMPMSTAVSMVVNEPGGGPLIYHIGCEIEHLERVANAGVSDTRMFVVHECREEYCDHGSPLPVAESGVEWTDVPSHKDAL